MKIKKNLKYNIGGKIFTELRADFVMKDYKKRKPSYLISM